MTQRTNDELLERVERKLSAWKEENPGAGTVCVANCDELDFFPVGASVLDVLKTLRDSRGMSREEALNYLCASQFSDAAIH